MKPVPPPKPQMPHKEWLISFQQACQHCGSLAGLTIDHIIPLSHGGPKTIGNWQVLCGLCNGQKASKSVGALVEQIVLWCCGEEAAVALAERIRIEEDRLEARRVHQALMERQRIRAACRQARSRAKHEEFMERVREERWKSILPKKVLTVVPEPAQIDSDIATIMKQRRSNS